MAVITQKNLHVLFLHLVWIGKILIGCQFLQITLKYPLLGTDKEALCLLMASILLIVTEYAETDPFDY